MKFTVAKSALALSVLGMTFGSVVGSKSFSGREVASTCSNKQEKVLHSEVANLFEDKKLILSSIGDCASPVQRIFNFDNQKLTPAEMSSSIALASYVGVDPATGDSAVIKNYGNDKIQLILNICRTGDLKMDDLLESSVPEIQQAFSGDLNVPNKAACPGRINIGSVIFGYISGVIPVQSTFQPPQKCLQ